MRWDELPLWKKIMIVAGVVFVLFWMPFARQIILFILPLGSGVDDLVFLSAGLVFGVLYLVNTIRENRRKQDE